MGATATHPWNSECRIAIGRALVRRGGGAMTAPELAAASGKHRSNVKKTAEGLAEEGALQRRRAPAGAGSRPGPKPSASYAFAEGAEEAFLQACGPETDPGSLAPGDQLIFLDAAQPGAEIRRCLASAGVGARVDWSALCDGRGQELMIALRGADAVNASLDLIGALEAAKLEARRVSVTKVDSAAELFSWASAERSR